METVGLAGINNAVAVPVNRMISAWKSGQARQDFQSQATTWGQLKQELVSRGFSLSDVRITEGNTQIDLVNDDALLPVNINKRGTVTNDLVILMTPQTKIKSGMVDTKTASYKELKAEIKDLCNAEATQEKAKAHFGNYTQMSTDNMRKFLSNWYSSNKAKASKKEAPVSKKEVVKETPKPEPVKKSKNKLDSVREKLEKKDFTPSTPETTFNEDKFNEALQYVLFGVTQLQNEVFASKKHDLPSDDELSAMAKRLKN